MAVMTSWVAAITAIRGWAARPQKPSSGTSARRAVVTTAHRPACRLDQATSKRSRFMTLSHAATKSRTNFSFESSLA